MNTSPVPRSRPLSATAPQASPAVFGNLWRASGLPGRIPPGSIVPMPGFGELRTNVIPRAGGGVGVQNRVFLPPRTAANIYPLPGYPGGGVGVMLHEFAHSRQPMTLRPWVREGMAQAFARAHEQAVSNRLGIPFAPAPPGHDLWARRYVSQFGTPSIGRYGQLG